MKIIPPSHEIIQMPSLDILQLIEKIGRTCYKSEDKITTGSARKFIEKILNSGHHSVIEHVNVSVRFICDRGVSHEIVRHRLASYSQESTRYVNYSKDKFGNGITVIEPFYWERGSIQYERWRRAMEYAEKAYIAMIQFGATPQEARSVLPNSLKTELVMTCNLREWRHVLNLRCSKRVHPQIQEVMLPLLKELQERIPPLFDDLYEKYFLGGNNEKRIR